MGEVKGWSKDTEELRGHGVLMWGREGLKLRGPL